MFTIFDIIGFSGAVLMVTAFLGLSSGKIGSGHLIYLLANITGAGLVIISLLHDWNLPSFLMESSWFLISIYGLVKKYRRG